MTNPIVEILDGIARPKPPNHNISFHVPFWLVVTVVFAGVFFAGVGIGWVSGQFFITDQQVIQKFQVIFDKERLK